MVRVSGDRFVFRWYKAVPGQSRPHDRPAYVRQRQRAAVLCRALRHIGRVGIHQTGILLGSRDRIVLCGVPRHFRYDAARIQRQGALVAVLVIGFC